MPCRSRPCIPFAAGVSTSSAPSAFKRLRRSPAHALRHGKDKPITLNRSGIGKADACVATGRLNNQGIPVDQPLFLCICNQGIAHAVFHAAQGVKALHLRKDAGVQPLRLSKAAQLHKRSISNQFQQVLGDLCHIKSHPFQFSSFKSFNAAGFMLLRILQLAHNRLWINSLPTIIIRNRGFDRLLG